MKTLQSDVNFENLFEAPVRIELFNHRAIA